MLWQNEDYYYVGKMVVDVLGVIQENCNNEGNFVIKETLKVCISIIQDGGTIAHSYPKGVGLES